MKSGQQNLCLKNFVPQTKFENTFNFFVLRIQNIQILFWFVNCQPLSVVKTPAF